MAPVEVEPPQRRKHRILVVDEDETLRETLSELLHAEGYDVVTAGSTPAALRRIADETVDLVLTNYRLSGGATGLDLIEDAREIRPGIASILMTESPNHAHATESARRSPAAFLAKPFEVEEPVRMIREMLSTRGK